MALLAGGLATRLRPITETIPKSMLTVAGEPFIAHQLRLLARQGIDRLVICTGYLGDQIEKFVGTGEAFGCRVSYSRDGSTLLGTAGSLRKALPLLGDSFFVMYGDSYLPTSFRAVFDAFLRTGQPALMTVFRNCNQWDVSNVEFVGDRIVQYEKKLRSAAMKHIDYGLGVLDAGRLAEWKVPDPSDLADYYKMLVAENRLAAHEVGERFYEIGSPAGLAETDAYLMGDARSQALQPAGEAS
jgi:NDP-sugar pyrophosphorylase family protein